MHTISFNLLNHIYGVGLLAFMSWNSKLDFGDVKHPVQDNTAIERHKQCGNHSTPKPRFSVTTHCSLSETPETSLSSIHSKGVKVIPFGFAKLLLRGIDNVYQAM